MRIRFVFALKSATFEANNDPNMQYTLACFLRAVLKGTVGTFRTPHVILTCEIRKLRAKSIPHIRIYMYARASNTVRYVLGVTNYTCMRCYVKTRRPKAYRTRVCSFGKASSI